MGVRLLFWEMRVLSHLIEVEAVHQQCRNTITIYMCL